MRSERAAGGLDFEAALRGRRVVVTGHTGFTGSWLTLWLHAIDAHVTGLSLYPQSSPNLYQDAGVEEVCTSNIGDIRSLEAVESSLGRADPEVIFHLAAQPLVSRSCVDPIETITTNVVGTAHVFEAARRLERVKAVVCVTTDKVYLNKEWVWGYREDDRLGGKDPYSASKACAELIAASYRETLTGRDRIPAIATARGGNIIGGGDWSENRIVPDFARAVRGREPLILRCPESVRPWQHVLALVHGYLVLAAELLRVGDAAAGSWNLGPSRDEAKTVRDLVTTLGREWESPEIRYEDGGFPETRFLHLDSTRARSLLGWHPPLSFDQTVAMTAQWYAAYCSSKTEARALCDLQIADYRRQVETAVV